MPKLHLKFGLALSFRASTKILLLILVFCSHYSRYTPDQITRHKREGCQICTNTKVSTEIVSVLDSSLPPSLHTVVSTLPSLLMSSQATTLNISKIPPTNKNKIWGYMLRKMLLSNPQDTTVPSIIQNLDLARPRSQRHRYAKIVQKDSKIKRDTVLRDIRKITIQDASPLECHLRSLQQDVHHHRKNLG